MNSWIVPLIVGLAGAAVTFITARWGRKGDRENALIDQLQEERVENRRDLTELKARVDSLEERVARLLGRDALWSIHATRLEAQVIDLGGTPHPRPAELQEAA